MRTWQSILALAIAAATLTGCGKNPAASTPVQQTKRFGAASTRTVAAKPVPASNATVVSPAAVTVATRPAAPSSGAAKPVAGPVAALPGALRLKVRTFGASSVGSLVLNVVSQADPSAAATVPMAMSGAEATWETEELPAGAYDLNLELRDAAGKRIGGGKALATIVPGEVAAVTVDITVEPAPVAPAPSASPVPGGDPGVAASPSPSPAPSASPSAGLGGTLGIRVEFQ